MFLAAILGSNHGTGMHTILSTSLTYSYRWDLAPVAIRITGSAQGKCFPPYIGTFQRREPSSNCTIRNHLHTVGKNYWFQVFQNSLQHSCFRICDDFKDPNAGLSSDRKQTQMTWLLVFECCPEPHIRIRMKHYLSIFAGISVPKRKTFSPPLGWTPSKEGLSGERAHSLRASLARPPQPSPLGNRRNLYLEATISGFS